MYLLSACCISPQDTFTHDGLLSSVRVVEGNRWPCIEPDYKTYITDAALRRRMSRIVKMGVAAALGCVKSSGITQPDAIITATGLGCLADTEKFMAALIERQEQQLNPTPFIQSTFNTVGAQIALLLNNQGYNNTYAHSGCAFESALIDALMQIGEANANNVLAGCYDEMTDTCFEIMQRLGFWKKNLDNSCHLYENPSSGSAAGEGTAFFMLSNRLPANTLPIKLSGVRSFRVPADHVSLLREVELLLANGEKTSSDIDLLLLGNNGDASGDLMYRQLIEYFPRNKGYCFFKNLCGEYPTSSAFALYLAFNLLKSQHIAEGIIHRGNMPGNITNVLIYNHYQKVSHSLMLCSLCH